MYGGIGQGLLNMHCDIYTQQKTQDASHGTIVREWVFNKNIECHIDIISTTGTSNFVRTAVSFSASLCSSV